MLRCDVLSWPYQIVGVTAPSVLNHDVILFCCERFELLTWLGFPPTKYSVTYIFVSATENSAAGHRLIGL